MIDGSLDSMVFGQVNLSHNLLKLVAIVLAKVEISLLKKMSWPHDEWVTWLGGWDTLNLNHKGYSKSNRTQRQKNICITNWGKLVLQIEAALFYYKLGQTLLQIGAASLLQIGASVVTNWGSYYKLGQPLLQNRAAITNWGRYYKLWQLLQIGA